jgi:glycosidase
MIQSLLISGLMLQSPGPTVDHKFVYDGALDLKTVTVAGTFNGWNKDKNPMQRSPGSGRWETTIQLAPGTYEYKFVLNGTDYVLDPNAKSVPDGNGNTNSLLSLIPEAYKLKPGVSNDGIITEFAIGHLQNLPLLNYNKGTIEIGLRSRAGDVASTWLFVDGAPARALTKVSSDGLTDNYKIKVPWNRRSKISYTFQIKDGSRSWFLGPKGLSEFRNITPFTLDPMTYKPFEVPTWVEGTVFYQIFPDRFFNGDKSNDPHNVAAWDSKPNYSAHLGGDAAGVKEKLHYLKAIGVNGVYFNPVMMAPAYHRYDPVDFYQIDHSFGTNKEFIDLTHQMEGEGIRVVLDQIFDHVGVTFAPFADVLQFQQESEYKDWFFIKKWPVKVEPNPNYVGWWGTEWMPKVNLANKGVYNYLMESVDFWMKNAKLSGWRLDVANEVPAWFWQDFRKRVKGIDQDAWIVGEVWTEAGEWLGGDQWDASMNYPFRNVLMNYIAKGTTTPTEFVQGLQRVHGLYAGQVSRNQLNLISSHDTPRFLSEAGNDRKLQAMAAVVQFSWPGAPSIYYGEEIGMEGKADPDNRRGMRWDMVQPNNELLDLYTKLIHVRTKSKLLAEGEPITLPCDDKLNIAAYGRELGKDFSVTILNRSDKAFSGKIQLPKSQAGKAFTDVISGKTFTADALGHLRVELQPVSALLALNASNTHLKLVADAKEAAIRATQLKEPNP